MLSIRSPDSRSSVNHMKEPEIWQRSDGTVYRKINKTWFYLSPLFGEWLPVFDKEPERDELKPYPRNLPNLVVR